VYERGAKEKISCTILVRERARRLNWRVTRNPAGWAFEFGTRRKTMFSMSDKVIQDVCDGQVCTSTVSSVSLRIEVEEHAGAVLVRLHVGNGGDTPGKSLTMERVVPSLEVFCAQLGPDADDVLWRCSAP